MNREVKRQFGSLALTVMEGDITRVRADALIAAINSGGFWFGGIDRAIERVAGGVFHQQAAALGTLKHMQTIVAKKQSAHEGKFGDVVFVVDDLEGPLSALILIALTEADKAGYKSVSLPAIRTGVMRGVVEKSLVDSAMKILSGIEAFSSGHSGPLEEVTIVIYNQPDLFDTFNELMTGTYTLAHHPAGDAS